MSLANRSRAVLMVVAAALVAGCATTIQARHAPLYDPTPHTTSITADAKADAGISEIQVDVTIGEITACTELGQLLPSVIPCRRKAQTFSQVCAFAGSPKNGSCTFTRALQDRSLVTYTATVRPSGGSAVTSSPITYAGGASLTSATIHFPLLIGEGFTIPWEVARPIWWHTGAPSSSAQRSQQIDVGFFPDADYASYPAFAIDMRSVVEGAFFNTSSAQTFAQNYTFWKGLFNLTGVSRRLSVDDAAYRVCEGAPKEPVCAKP